MTVITTQAGPQVHSMFRGDSARATKTLTKKKIIGKVLNANTPVTFQTIPVVDLLPLETQRETKETWTTSRLKDLGGFDVLAAGALMVAHDPNDGNYYVFDGCGRLAQAQINGAPTQLPCLVYDITKERAAFYFAYNQDKGRRSLSKEVIFVNAYYSGDKEAVEWADRLNELNCYVKGTTDYAVPHPQKAGHPEIKYRALTEGYKLAGGDMELMKLVRNMICQAWGGTQSGVDIIRQDLFLGMIMFMQIYPEAQTNGLNKALQQFLNATANLTPQGKLSWKHDGGNQHNQEAHSVAYGLTKAFRGSQFFKTNFGATITFKRFESFDPSVLTV
jgi:hypothetical protein